MVYRAKTRFAKFFNLPELTALYKEGADIRTPDLLKLFVPEAEYENAASARWRQAQRLSCRHWQPGKVAAERNSVGFV